jgi:hypothetical protein
MANRIVKLLGIGIVTAMIGLLGGTAAFAGNNVPFQGTFSGEGTLSLADLRADFHGSGIASHLGQSTYSGAAILDLPAATNECDAGWGIHNINTETLVAANGDQFVVQFDDVACPIGNAGDTPSDPFEPIFHGDGVWQVVGGTGRFAGASGNGVVDGEINFLTGKCHWTLLGTIAY